MKLFVGQIPKTMEESAIRPIMEEFGVVKDVKVIKDKQTGAHRGCCFVTFDTQQQADYAIAGLHNIRVLGGLSTPMQVKYAEGEQNQPHKLFVGMLTRSTTEQELQDIFVPFGDVEEVAILRGPNNVGKGCGFVRYKSRDSALKAISALNGAYKLEGAPENIIVKFADSDKVKLQKKAAHQPLAMPSSSKMLDPNAAAALYQINPLLASIASNPLAATLLPTIAAALGIPTNGAPMPTPTPLPAPSMSQPSGAYPGYPYNPNVPVSAATAYSLPQYQNPAMASYQTPAAQEAFPQREGPSGCNLFIYHLPQEYSDTTLSQLFSAYGNVLSAKVFVDKMTMQSKCFGFVSYDKPESAAAAIAGLNGLQLGYKRLKVSLKKSDTQQRAAPY